MFLVIILWHFFSDFNANTHTEPIYKFMTSSFHCQLWQFISFNCTRVAGKSCVITFALHTVKLRPIYYLSHRKKLIAFEIQFSCAACICSEKVTSFCMCYTNITHTICMNVFVLCGRGFPSQVKSDSGNWQKQQLECSIGKRRNSYIIQFSLDRIKTSRNYRTKVKITKT